VDSVALRSVEATFEALLLQPLLEPLEASLGPIGSLAFEPMLARLLEAGHG